MKKKMLLIYFIIFVSSLTFVFAQVYFPGNNIRPTDHTTIKKDSTYHLFYTYYNLSVGGGSSSTDPNADFFGHATSSDLSTWTDQANVIDVGTTNSWDSKNVWAPHVILFNGTYFMFYTGVNYSANTPSINTQQIGIANSTDLVTWNKDPNNPIWNCSQAAWAEWLPGQANKAQCREAMVYRDDINNNFLMYYMAKINNTNHFIVGVANSTDLTTWIDSGNISVTESTKVESPFMLLKDGVYYLTWTDNSGVQYANSSNSITGFVAQGLVPENPAGRGLASESPFLSSTNFYTTYGNSADLDNKIEFRKLKFYSNGTFSPVSLADCNIYNLDCHLDSDDESVGNNYFYTVFDSEELNDNLFIQSNVPAEIYVEECHGALVCFWEKVRSAANNIVPGSGGYFKSLVKRKKLSCNGEEIKFIKPTSKLNLVVNSNFKLETRKDGNLVEDVTYSLAKKTVGTIKDLRNWVKIASVKSSTDGYASTNWNTLLFLDGNYTLNVTYTNITCKLSKTINVVIDNSVPTSNYHKNNPGDSIDTTSATFKTAPDLSVQTCVFNFNIEGIIKSITSVPDTFGICSHKIDKLQPNSTIYYNWSISDGLNWTYLENKFVFIQATSSPREHKSFEKSKLILIMIVIILVVLFFLKIIKINSNSKKGK